MMEKIISAKTTDFQPDEEKGVPAVYDNQKVIVGGMIMDKTIKYTKNNQVMCFLTLEDLVGTVEIVVFPRDYAKCQSILEADARVFIQGRVSAEDDKASKLILEKARLFDSIPREVWIQFADRQEYGERESELLEDLKKSPGNCSVVIYLKDVKAMKKLPIGYQVGIQDSWFESMCKKYGTSNVKVVERVLKNL
jgi:DNA polymerase-3 subunit alpha